MIEHTTIVRRREDVLASHMDGETIMMSIEQGCYYALDPIGGRLWELIAAPTPVMGLIEMLTGEFDVHPEVCARDTLRFLNELHAVGIIEVIDAAPP